MEMEKGSESEEDKTENGKEKDKGFITLYTHTSPSTLNLVRGDHSNRADLEDCIREARTPLSYPRFGVSIGI